jgi:hypothetical protein
MEKMSTNKITIEKIDNGGYHYMFLGRRYESRLDLKNELQMRAKTFKVTTEYFTSLVELNLVRRFKNEY